MIISRRALLPALALCLLPLGSVFAAPTNTIQSIKTVQTRVVQIRAPQSRAALAVALVTTYDVTVSSTDDFPMNDSVVTLSIGGKEFINSSYGLGGTLKTLVFSLTRPQFQSLKTGDPVLVYYGQDNAALPAAQWGFGTLNLSMLDKPAASTQTIIKVKPGK